MRIFRLAPVATIAAIAMVVAAIGFTRPASADVITYSLTTDDCSGGCGTAPFGTVTVSSISSTEVSVSVTLAAGEVFAVSGAGHALVFDLTGNPTISISGLTSGFGATSTASGHTIHADGTGDWQYSVDCTSCGGGTSPPTNAGPLNFDITVASGITPESFIQNGDGLFFSVDIGSGCTGSPLGNCTSTGDVAATTGIPSNGPPSVPEPSSLSILGFGLLAFGIVLGRWRRRAHGTV
ncbi:MAG TPA: PEP-CTERM sorting domain-containing protein [Stellaceae bacterium]|nr:PEP-CTERM sorting domain-containing protein [Stellaceae bacterium]